MNLPGVTVRLRVDSLSQYPQFHQDNFSGEFANDIEERDATVIVTVAPVLVESDYVGILMSCGTSSSLQHYQSISCSPLRNVPFAHLMTSTGMPLFPEPYQKRVGPEHG